MNGSVFLTILLIFLLRSNAAPFSTNTFVTFQRDTQLNTLAIEEFDISGSLIQKISLPSNYQAASGPRKLHLDASSSILALLASESVSNTIFCHTLNANAEKADVTTFNSLNSVDCIVEGQDVWTNYQSGIAYAVRGSSLVATSGNSIVNTVISQILSMEKVGTKLFVADAAGTLYSGDPIVKSGTMSMNTVLSSPAAAAFYIHNQNTLYTISVSRPISRFTLDPTGTTATNVWTYTPSNLTYLPRSIIAMDVAGKTYIFVAYYFNDNGTYKFFVQRFIDDSTTLTNPLIIIQPGVDEIFSISPSPITSCTDKLVNQDETDVDCGGSKCSKCVNDKKCLINGDCNSGFCNANKICKTPTCSDLVKNQDETDVDCGGSICTKCATGKQCKINGDCVGGVCTAGTCAATCSDTVKNQDESDVDCGGSICAKCGNNRLCTKNSDCFSTFCNPVTTKCANPSCIDTFKNQDETDIDCGGSICTKCATGKQCKVNGDCVGGLCTAGTCAPTCSDTVKNQDETDVDCGGSTCAKCANNKLCLSGSDCSSTFCNPVTNKCATPTCIDTFKNQDETDVDCGGSTCATKCAIGKQCKINGDCSGGLCTAGTCAPSCSDSIKNQDETDVDCGGTKCQACPLNKLCLSGSDCSSSFCNPVTTKCAAPTCIDTFKNQDETDVDCGGSICTKCATGKQCKINGDCVGGVCTAGTCAATCSDTVKNQDESDVDCGGQTCTACDIGKVCALNSDCKSNNCASNLCAAAPVAVPQAPVAAPVTPPLAAPVATPQAPIAGPVAPIASPVTTPVATPQTAPVASPVDVPLASPQAAPSSAPATTPQDVPVATPTDVPVNQPNADVPVAQPLDQSPLSDSSPTVVDQPTNSPSTSTPIVFQLSNAFALHMSIFGLISALLVQSIF